MVYSQSFFVNIVIWFSSIFFIISLIPQIFLNHKLKTARGWSDLFILGKLNSQICNLGYTFFSALPLAYKILNPLYFAFVLLIVFQRLYYLDFKKEKKVLWLYFANVLLVLGMIALTVFKFSAAIPFLGWLPVIISLWKLVPQMVRIQVKKSVRGFSLGFIILVLIAYFIEIGAVLILRLPGQVLWQDLKGPFCYLIFLAQFALYRKKSDNIVSEKSIKYA